MTGDHANRFGPVEMLVRFAGDPDRPGLEFLDLETDRVAVTAWTHGEEGDRELWIRTWREIDLWALEEIAGYAERELLH